MTLIELVLATTILVMVLAGVTSLAFALSSARDKTGEVSRKQAHLRFAMVHLGDVIKHSRLVCYSSESQAVLWTLDVNADGRMNINEMATIHTNPEGTEVVLSQYLSAANPEVAISAVAGYSSQWWLAYGAAVSDATVIPECSNARILTDAAASAATYISVLFDMTLDGQTAGYSISGRLQARTANVLDSGGNIVSDDD
jgi:Tfp pilus assembly protein PilW